MMYLVAANIIGNLFVKELVKSEVDKQSCHTLPMQENIVELLQEMVDVKAANGNTAVQNDPSNLVTGKKVL